MLQSGSQSKIVRRKNVKLIYLKRKICSGLGARSVRSGEKIYSDIYTVACKLHEAKSKFRVLSKYLTKNTKNWSFGKNLCQLFVVSNK